MTLSPDSTWPDTRLHDQPQYERHPRPDTAHRGTRASTSRRDQVPDASNYLNDLNDPLTLASSLDAPSGTFPPAAPFSFPSVDFKCVSTPTPHTRPMQALEPPAEDGPVYLHLPQYGGFSNSSHWSNMQYVFCVCAFLLPPESSSATEHTRRHMEDKIGCTLTRASPRCLRTCK